MGVLASFFFFNDAAPTEIYTLSLHDALPIYFKAHRVDIEAPRSRQIRGSKGQMVESTSRSEEHTSELQSPDQLVCRLLLEKKKIAHACFYLGRHEDTLACAEHMLPLLTNITP